MSSKEVGIEDGRKKLGEYADAAHHHGEITYLTRYGRQIAAVVPINRISKEPTMTVTLYETNSEVLVIAKGDNAWSLYLAGNHMEGMFAKDAEAWVNGEWEPNEADGQSPTDVDDDLLAVAEWTALDGVRLLDTGHDTLGGAAKDYIGPDAYTATVGEDNAEWLSGQHGPTAQYDKSVRITDLGDGKIRVPAGAIEILLGLNDSWDGVVDKENGVLRIHIEGTAYRLTPAEDE